MTKYIPLEEVEKFLIGQYGFRQFQINTLREIPTIDPIEEIDKMIEEIKEAFPYDKTYTQFGEGLITGKLDSLEMLKKRLSLTQK